MLTIGPVLAVGSAVSLNWGFVLQHRGAVGAPPLRRGQLRAGVGALLRSRPWIVGVTLAAAGWALYIAALGFAPVSLVQAFVAGGLALLVPLGALLLRRPVGRGAALATLVMAGGLALLALGQHPGGAHGAFRTPVAAAYVGGAAVLAGLLGLLWRGRRRAQALGLASGVAFAGSDLSVKAITGLVARHGLLHGVLTPWLLAVAVTEAGAALALQRGLQSDQPLAVIALMGAANDVLTIAGGFVVFGDALGASPAWKVVHLVGFGIVVAAAVVLARAEAELTGTPR